MACRSVGCLVLGVVVAGAASAYAQIDDRLLNLAARVGGASWRVFGVEPDPTQPLAIAGVQEVKQQRPPIRNLAPGQTRRQETPIRGAILSVTDRVAFVPFTVTVAGSTWTVADAQMRDAVKRVAQTLPVP